MTANRRRVVSEENLVTTWTLLLALCDFAKNQQKGRSVVSATKRRGENEAATLRPTALWRGRRRAQPGDSNNDSEGKRAR